MQEAPSAPLTNDDRPPRRRAIEAAIAVLALASVFAMVWTAVDSYAEHGVSVRWEAEHRGRMIEVARTTEHRAEFPSQYRALSRIVEAWDYDRYGIPRTLPAFRATLEARFWNTTPLHLRADGVDAAEVFVDGQRAEGAIDPGLHRLRVVWTGRRFQGGAHPRSPTRLSIERSDDGTAWEEISPTFLVPQHGHADRAWGALFVWLAFVLVAAPLAYAFAAARRVRARWLGITALSAILVVGLTFRLFDYAVMPHFMENGDELFATWNGWSLLTDGTTRGWSFWPNAYGSGVEHEILPYWSAQGSTWHIVKPYFEHPPLAHVLVGAAAKLGGATHFAHGRLTHTRLVPILLSLVTMLLTFLVGRRLTKHGVGPWLGVLLYAVLPFISIQNRAIKEEMLLTPMALASVYLYLRWRDGAGTRALMGAAFIAGLAACTKANSAIFVPALAMMVAAHGRYRLAAMVVGAGILGVVPLFVYGAIIDWDVFWITLVKQATGRPTHWNLFPRFFADGLIIHNLIGHGPTLFLWLCYGSFVFGRGKKVDPAWIVFPLVYLIALVVSAGNWMFGWYMLPVYPFLCLAAGEQIAELFRRPHPFGGLVFASLLVMYWLNFTATPEYFKSSPAWGETRAWVSLFVIGMIGPHIASYALKSSTGLRRLAQLATAVGLAMLVVLGGYFVFRYEAIYDTHRDFDRDSFFDR
jgi:4-amino-4-deoxy-L-arabinose transferase-like glycosyltransferase